MAGDRGPGGRARCVPSNYPRGEGDSATNEWTTERVGGCRSRRGSPPFREGGGRHAKVSGRRDWSSWGRQPAVPQGPGPGQVGCGQEGWARTHLAACGLQAVGVAGERLWGKTDILSHVLSLNSHAVPITVTRGWFLSVLKCGLLPFGCTGAIGVLPAPTVCYLRLTGVVRLAACRTRPLPRDTEDTHGGNRLGLKGLSPQGGDLNITRPVLFASLASTQKGGGERENGK